MTTFKELKRLAEKHQKKLDKVYGAYTGNLSLDSQLAIHGPRFGANFGLPD